MMVTIHGLPPRTKYQDVKAIIRQECSITDFIMDCLVDDGPNAKKVRVGVPDETEGYRILKALEGFRMSATHILNVIPVGKSNSMGQHSYDQRSDLSNQRSDYQSQSNYSNQSMVNYGNRGQENHISVHSSIRHGSQEPIQPRSDAPDQRMSRPQGGYDDRQSHLENRYQQIMDHRNQGQIDQRHQIGSLRQKSQGTIETRHVPFDKNRPGQSQAPITQWGSNVNPISQSNQWSQQPQNDHGQLNKFSQHQTQSFGQQIRPQQSYPQGRVPDQGYGFQSKNNSVPDRRVPPVNRAEQRPHVLRSVELQDPPAHSAQRHTPQFKQDKPTTINKDNFKGPTQYNVSRQEPAHFPGQSPALSHSWTSQSTQPKPQPFEDRRQNIVNKIPEMVKPSQGYDVRDRFSPRKRPMSPGGRDSPPRNVPGKPYHDNRHPIQQGRHDFSSTGRLSSPGRNVIPPGRHISPNRPGNRDAFVGRPLSPVRRDMPRRMSPRLVSPSRRVSPARKVSPLRGRISPPGRRIAQGLAPSDGRRISPSGSRRISPSGSRRISPSSGRRISPSGGRLISPSGARRISPTGVRRILPSSARRISPTSRRVSPPSGRRFSPSGGRRTSPLSGRRITSPGIKRFSPSEGRRISPPAGRRISPTGGRRISPPEGRRFSPTGVRRISPSGGRRFSPPVARRVSPPGRKMSPPGRRMSPKLRDDLPKPNMPYDFYPEGDRRAGRRNSPGRRSVSPPMQARYPAHHHGDQPEFMEVVKGKPVRPAYEPQGQKQSYSGGYRPNVQENVQYPPAGGRQLEQKPAPWQNEKIVYSDIEQKEQDRLDKMRSNLRLEQIERPSRSPIRRERSPLKDRYRRRSPSPRSPRRSWALERRHSPEMKEPPPPPIWPGQNTDNNSRKIRFQREEKLSVWDRADPLENEDRRHFNEKVRIRNDLEDKFQKKEDKFSTIEFEDRRDYNERKQHERDREYHRKENEDLEFRRDSPRREEKKVFADIDKDFQDIYKRAVEFRKKTEELRKFGDRRHEDRRRSIDDDRQLRQDSPRRDDTSLRLKNLDHRDTDWKSKDRPRITLMSEVKAKRDMAVNEIAEKIISRYSIELGAKNRIMFELKLSLFNILLDMFGSEDVSFIECVIKYQAKYKEEDEDKLMKDLSWGMTSKHRYAITRKIDDKDPSEIPAKISKCSPSFESRVSDWNTGQVPPKVVAMPVLGMVSVPDAGIQSGMVPPQVYMQPQIIGHQNHFMQQQIQFQTQIQQHQEVLAHPTMQNAQDDCYNLYICQDDFEPYSDMQANYLKNFLVSQIVKASEMDQGWAPDFTLKGIQSRMRYEVSTKDEMSKNWILNLDFSEFEYFNVLVYTKEELWYERAAIWLPGHSRSRKIEPLDKLKMQNRMLEGVNIGKWKFVKKIVTLKGTRLYVDMPPSSARALEKHKMLLSYELQKVNVILKAVAVDKDSFDAGLKEVSVVDPSLLVTAVQNSPMPILNANHEPGLVKVGVHGMKTITLDIARKIKEAIVYHLFKYHRGDGVSRTDFLKHGYCISDCFGIVPENTESKRWLMKCHFGKVLRRNIVVFGADDDNTKYFKFVAYIPNEKSLNTALVFERLKQSNQGVKGIHFNLWKPIKISLDRDHRGRERCAFEMDIDLDSVETLINMRMLLEYVNDSNVVRVNFKSEYSYSKLEEKVRKCKMEDMDSYDVANMDLDSDSDQDIIFLD